MLSLEAEKQRGGEAERRRGGSERDRRGERARPRPRPRPRSRSRCTLARALAAHGCTEGRYKSFCELGCDAAAPGERYSTLAMASVMYSMFFSFMAATQMRPLSTM
jgi:hypothetical protein